MSITLVIFELRMGVLDFPLFFQVREVFAHDASFTTVKSIFDQDSKYNDVNHLVTFIDNHDRDRFSAWLMTTTRSCVLRWPSFHCLRYSWCLLRHRSRTAMAVVSPTEWAGIANKENREVMPSFSEDGITYRSTSSGLLNCGKPILACRPVCSEKCGRKTISAPTPAEMIQPGRK